MNLKGTLPVLILQVVSQGERHGYAIAKEIKQRSQDVLNFQEGVLYPTLHTLEAEGLLTSTRRKENNRPRRYYTLTENGHTALAKEREAWENVSHAVNLILEGST